MFKAYYLITSKSGRESIH